MKRVVIIVFILAILPTFAVSGWLYDDDGATGPGSGIKIRKTTIELSDDYPDDYLLGVCEAN